jgi:arylsulfatase A-like enzyme
MTTHVPDRATVRDVISIVVGAAMISACVFCLRAAYLLTLGGGFAGVSRDFVWMSAASYLVLYGLLVPLLIVMTWLRSRDQVLGVAVFATVALGVFDLAMPFSGIATIASFIFALGAGAWAARRSAGTRPHLARALRGVAVGVALPLAVAAAVMAVATRPSHRDVVDATASGSGPPNILLIIWDTVRATQLSLYGYATETTPKLVQLASRGATFDAAVSTAPWTLPSHASMFTGRYPQHLSTDVLRRLDDREPTLAEILGRAGYATLGIVGNVAYASWESGLARGFAEYQDYRRGLRQVLRTSLIGQTTMFDAILSARMEDVRRTLRQPSPFAIRKPGRGDERDAREITDAFLRWHETRSTGAPYFAFLNYIDAHAPLRPPDAYRARFAKRRSRPAFYDAEIAYIDHEVGRLLSELEQRGELERTLVIVTADHGEHFGERGLYGHHNSVYTQTVRVPLVMRFDGHMPAGIRVPPVVSLRDLGATVLEYAGVAPGVPFPGASLSRYWTAATDSGSAAVSPLGRMRKDLSALDAQNEVAVFDDRWHLVRVGKRQFEELFDYRRDPLERRNVIGIDSLNGVRERLQHHLRRALQDDARGRLP